MSMEPGCALANSSVMHRDGGGRSDFAQIHAADSVRNHKEKAVGARLLARGRDKGAHGVFIVGTDFAKVACLAELYVQHMRRRVEHLAQLQGEMPFFKR